MPGSFIDTNILVYMFSEDRPKADGAERIVASGGTISVQVLNEFVNVARRKQRLPWNRVHEMLSGLRELLTIVPVTTRINDIGLAMAERYSLQLDDSMVVAAAIGSGCDTLWSEDMQDGLLIDGTLRIANPFRESGPTALPLTLRTK